MRPENPYFYGPMVTDPKMFFGREDELRRLRDQLRKGASTAVIGLRRIGKSSVLYQLAQQRDALPEGVVAVYLDLQDAAHHRPLGLLTTALQRLDQKLGNRYNFGPVENLADFSTAVKKVKADRFQPALCLDEVEELTDRDVFDDDFFEGLRALGNAGTLAFVTASGESLDVLIQQSGRTSRLYNIFTNLHLAGLCEEGVWRLLIEPFERAGLTPFSDDELAYVLELAGRYPFYLQMVGYHLFEMRAKSGGLDRTALRQAFILEASPHLRGLWRHLNPDEQVEVKKLAGIPAAVREWERTWANLLGCGLAEGDVEATRLFSTVFSDMVGTGEIEREHPARPYRGRQRRSERVDSVKLRQVLTTLFDENELRNLCFDLGVDYESLLGQGKDGKARELVAYMQRHGHIQELVEACYRLRPHAFD